LEVMSVEVSMLRPGSFPDATLPTPVEHHWTIPVHARPGGGRSGVNNCSRVTLERSLQVQNALAAPSVA
jgi:hypothetical protein